MAGENNSFGLINAVTRTAQDMESYNRATELERLGGEMLSSVRVKERPALNNVFNLPTISKLPLPPIPNARESEIEEETAVAERVEPNLERWPERLPEKLLTIA
jgi:hypothetical protein